MEEQKPLVSIIVRTKDRPELLKKALESIAAQTYRHIEVVLVNDGGCELPEDDLRTILKDLPLNYIKLEKNMGRAHAGNVGIENAKGDYIGFLDDDDEFYPEHIKILTDIMVTSGVYIAYTDAELVFKKFDKIKEYLENSRNMGYSQDFIPELFLMQNYIPFMCLLFHKSVFYEIKINESFEIFEDWNLLINLSQKYYFQHIKKVTAKYIQWSDESQINRKALSEEFSKEAYQRILRQNINKITPEVLYKYIVNLSTENKKIIFDLTRERNEKQHLKSEMQKLNSEVHKLETEKEEILQKLWQLQANLAEIANGLSWKMIERYQNFKGKLFPTGSRQRLFYDLLLKSIKVLDQEGLKGFLTRARRRMRFNPNYMRLRFKLKRYRALSFYDHHMIDNDYRFNKKPVHIIIPVYNGYESLIDCLNSVFRHSDLSFHTLIIIDDRSTDQRVADYLLNLKEKEKTSKIEILFNENNMGFVKTVNRGFKLSPQDVISLNSDTIVTSGWVEKLQRAAYSKMGVATATPLSNYVTINGIPKPFQFNIIPHRFDINSFAEFIEKVSLRHYPEIPAGVGFCLYIKRKVIDDIGYFDENKFEKGYAEETDFCMRAFKKGYTHVIDDATYIYHIGGVSFESVKDPKFLAEKNLMIENNLRILNSLHPEYMGLVNKALQENLAPVHEYINLRIELEGKRT